MKTYVFRFCIAVFLILCCSGCTSASLKMTTPATPPQLAKRELPVKFKFSTISWKTYSSILPIWFNNDQLGTFITLVKQRSPELFSDSEKALPLTFHVEHTSKNTSRGLVFLSFLTGFTIIPAIIDKDHNFTVEVRIGEPVLYTDRYSFTITHREIFSRIPFYALFMPAQSKSFCHEVISITNEAIATKELQNIFLNMIYNLDKEKLYRMYDDKFGEAVEMLGAEE